MNEALPQRAQFHHMKEGTQDDWEIIGAEFAEFRSTVVHRIKDHLLPVSYTHLTLPTSDLV